MQFPLPKNAHISYLEVKSPSILTDFLFSHLKQKENEILVLLKIGAIHINNTRVLQDLLLRKGDIIRVHLYPNRYPLDKILWENHLLYDCNDFVVLNKPAKIPVPPTVDNLHENVLHAFSDFMKVPLYITQRLDRGTTGILVFAKTKKFQSEYNKLLLENQLTKKYLALSEKAVPPGLQTHYIRKSTTIPKEVVSSPDAGFQECRLIVEKSTTYSYQGKECFESEIQLLTGRTHQIRAQYSFLGSPLLGDRTYGGSESAGFTFESFALHAFELKFKEHVFSTPPTWR